MVQSDSNPPACVCPSCGYRCSACMGTNSVLSPEDLKKLGEDEHTFLYEAIEKDLAGEDAEYPSVSGEEQPSDPYPVNRNFYRESGFEKKKKN